MELPSEELTVPGYERFIGTMKDSYPPLKAQQIRAARALLGWSQAELARRAELNQRTIALAEEGKSVPYDRTNRQLYLTFESQGVGFLDDGTTFGVTLTPRDSINHSYTSNM